MRYAVSIPPFTDPDTVVEMAREAEAAGWDGVFLWDHLQWSPEHKPDVFDPWVLLGAIATSTQRVRIGTLVTPLSRRRPQMIAKHLTTLDHLSGGRVTLGVGLGEPAHDDFGAFGDEPDARVRAQLLDESLAILDDLLRGSRSSHQGEHFSVDAQLRPGPVQQPRLPIWVAGVLPHRRPLRRARAWDGVVPIGSDDLITPSTLADYLGEAPPAGWDVVSPWSPGVPAHEYADVGVTWLFQSATPTGDWVDELRRRIRGGPMV
ncbi:MAG: LLM class flavin-dependent oxidoreductase [Nocardioidaceae bacterium]